MNLIDIASVCHEANRALQVIAGDPALSPHWGDAPDWQRESAIEGVRAVQEGATPLQLHKAWCASKVADGWVWGEVKDAEAKTHPCLIGYYDLPDDQIARDDLFHSIVQVLS